MKRWTLAITAVALAFALGAYAGDDEDEIEFEEAHVFFELNNTDGDLGIHGKVDGGPWKRIRIEGPNGRALMVVKARGRLRRQGLTELFFESAEPTFDELAPEEFFARFPEGTYEVEGKWLEGEELESETEVTHTMPAPPVASVNGEPMGLVCDDEDPDFDAPEVGAPVTISWAEVTMSHPDLGTQPPVEVEIVNYEVVVEVELEVDGEEFLSLMSAILPPGETSITIPDEFIAQGDEFKFEVLAREESFNQTATESCFIVD